MSEENKILSEADKLSDYEALSNKHKLFVRNLIACGFEAKEAYKRTYPKAKERTQEVNGSRLSNAEHIKKALKALADAVTEEYIILSLDKEAKRADKSSSRIQALTVLSDIKNMRKNQKTDVHTHLHTTRIEDIRTKLADKQQTRANLPT